MIGWRKVYNYGPLFWFCLADLRLCSILGVYDALQKKYLKTLLFCVCEALEGPMIEEYSCNPLKTPLSILDCLYNIWLVVDPERSNL